jgi:ABC-2 type transport system permease protein
MLRYARLEIRRMYREPRFVFLTLLMPTGFYLLFTNMFAQGRHFFHGLSAPVYMMISMSVFGALSAALAATGTRLAQERQSGWLRQLQVTPLSPWSVVAAKTLAAVILALPAIVLVSLVAVATEGVSLDAWQWAAVIPVLWAGSFPFAALGVLIGATTRVDTAQPLVMLALYGLNILGGILVSPDQFPVALRDISRALPSNRYAELGWDIASGHAPDAVSLAILSGWAVALCASAIIAYRGTTVKA